MKRLLIITMVILLLGTCTRATFSSPVETVMSVTPKQLTITFGQSFTINITVSNVTNLNLWQVALKYNATIINCTAAWIPQKQDVFANLSIIPVLPVLNDRTLDGYNYSLYGNALFSGSVNVSQGILCSFNFTTLAYGATLLQIATSANPIKTGDIYSPTSYYSYFLDPDQNEMLFTAQDISLQPLLTILSTPGGAAAPSPGNYSYTEGTNVSVIANPDTGYSLSNWLLDNSNAGSTNPITILMNANHTLQPVFSQANNYTLTIVGATGGNSSLAPGTYTYASGQTANISAIADPGYGFNHWMLDGSQAGSVNPITVLMNGNHTLVPVFSSTSFVYVYIRKDGSIDPTGAPFTTSDNVTYQFEGDLTATVMVQRSNISIVGNGHTLQGDGSGQGIWIMLVNNVSIIDLNIRNFDEGITLIGTSEDMISENNITANIGMGISLYSAYNNTIRRNNISLNKGDGIHLEYSSNDNSIFENNIENNENLAIYIDSSSDNIAYHNDVVNNTDQVHVAGNNFWDNGKEGNYWSNYTRGDSDLDAIGDTPYAIAANNTDHYPLMGQFSSFSLPQGNFVTIVSNSTISNFNYSSFEKRISFEVEGEQGTIGFCRLMIPHTLMDMSLLEVLIDNGSTPVLYSNLTLQDNTTHRWIYFSYQHSTHTIVIHEDTTPPEITVLSPENKTYSVNRVSLNFTVGEQTSWQGYSMDSSVNVTIAGNTTLTNLSDGPHSITVFANDTVGNMGRSDTILFTINTTPPTIVVLSPENKTYSVNSIPLNFTVSKQTSWEGYSLDGSANVTSAGNQTLNSLSDGQHSIIVYSNDTTGNIGSSNAVLFKVDTAPPNMTQVIQSPAENSVSPSGVVMVNVTVFDKVSGVKSVDLNCTYTNSSGTFFKLASMTNLQGNIWSAIIPGFPYGTNVTYVIDAQDNAGNNITTEKMGFHYQYEVVPEYSELFILPLLGISLLLAIVLTKRKKRDREMEKWRN